MNDLPSEQTTQTLATGFGHGKLILLGEHAVVHGQPALAASLPIGVRATAAPGNGRLRVPAWNIDVHAGDGSSVGTALDRLLTKLEAPPLDFIADAGIPAGAGLGSSAAMATALARAALAAMKRPEDGIADAVAASEGVFHGNPSGIDAACALGGRVGLYLRGDGWQPVDVRQKVKLLVGLSGERRETAQQVEAVGRLAARLPVARRLLEAMGDCARGGAEALAQGDIDTLGRLFDVAHGLLAGFRLSTPALDRLVHGARAAGAIGAKLTGAGGGGAVIALAPSHRPDVLARWKADGFDGFETVIGP